MEKLARFQSTDETVNRVQDQNLRILNPIINNPIIQGQTLPNIVLNSGSNNVNHGLGRALQGWFVVGISAPATIVDEQATNTLPTKWLVLSSSAGTTCSLYVY